MAALESHYSLPLPKFDKPVKLLIVVAPYYRDIADNLIAGARAVAASCGAEVDLVEVPGALEVPTAIAMAERLAEFDGYVALGCVIRGETTHYDTVCNDSSRALSLLGLQGACIGNGILTVENRAQAVVRADPAGQNKGGGAAAAALHLIALARKWAGVRKGIGFRPASGEKGMTAAKPDKRQMKSAARLYAVQALFQMEASGQTVEAVTSEFETHRFGAVYDGDEMAEGHVETFRNLIDQAVNWQAKIDQMTDRALVAKWPIDRIDPVLRALFRAAGGEMLETATPPKVVITEFVDIAKAFFPDGKEPKFVNAVLDHMAREARPEAFKA